MCGIAGLINLNGDPVSALNLKKMTDAIVHRGPDGEGHWIENNIGIGHRRLSVIDLSPAGKQPMITLDKRYVLSYNGEVYNYREIRAELERYGYKFRSQTDSEVVLNALAHWREGALLKFNGMYSLALWDRIDQTLLLARDRYGIKPLYYANQDCIFTFGSEQKAITSQEYFCRKLNQSALLEYFTFQNIFTDQTLLQDIYILPAGHYAKLHVPSGVFNQYQYWDFRFSEQDIKSNDDEYIEELDRLFVQAVNRQLVGDVELGSFLSGGIDSSLISAIASRKIPNLKTFTCGFDLSSASGIELGFDERNKAEALSAKYKTEHYQIVLKSGDMERCLPTLTWHLEEPRVGQSYPNFYANKLASKFVKVILSGCGGDELFGGYPWRYTNIKNEQNFKQYIDEYYCSWQRMLSNNQLAKVFSPIWSEVKHINTKEIFQDVIKNHKIEIKKSNDYINHSFYFEAKTFLHGLFVVEDKLSMAHSIECRLPFMDNDLVDFAMKCPVRLKLGNKTKNFDINENNLKDKFNYINNFNHGKLILREVSSRYIPHQIANAKKQGFSSPDSSWFKGESMDFVRKKLIDKNLRLYEILSKKEIVKLLDQHFSGEENRRLLIWSLLNINEWVESTL